MPSAAILRLHEQQEPYVKLSRPKIIIKKMLHNLRVT